MYHFGDLFLGYLSYMVINCLVPPLCRKEGSAIVRLFLGIQSSCVGVIGNFQEYVIQYFLEFLDMNLVLLKKNFFEYNSFTDESLRSP